MFLLKDGMVSLGLRRHNFLLIVWCCLYNQAGSLQRFLIKFTYLHSLKQDVTNTVWWCKRKNIFSFL